MEKSIKINILGIDYTIKFPNVGQLLDIESLKSALTNGTYGDLVRMNTITANEILDIADSIATFSVLVPEIKNTLKVKSYTEIDAITARKIVKSYKEQYFPWYNEINKELRALNDE